MNQLSDAFETNSLTLITMTEFFASLFSVANMAGNEAQRELQTII